MKWPTKHVLVRPASALVMALTLRGMSCFALTREEAGCEQAVARAFERYWVTTIECLVKCNEVPQATPTRSCAPEACLQKGRAKADEIIARRCVGAACPGCYPGGCPSYPDSVLDSVRSRAEALIGKLFCDDGASADGLTHAEGKCRESAARQLQRYVATFTECVGNCTRDVRGKKIPRGHVRAGQPGPGASPLRPEDASLSRPGRGAPGRILHGTMPGLARLLRPLAMRRSRACRDRWRLAVVQPGHDLLHRWTVLPRWPPRSRRGVRRSHMYPPG